VRSNEQALAGVPRNTKLADLLLTLVAMAESSATTQKCVVVGYCAEVGRKTASYRRTNLMLRRFVVDGSRFDLFLNCGLQAGREAYGDNQLKEKDVQAGRRPVVPEGEEMAKAL